MLVFYWPNYYTTYISTYISVLMNCGYLVQARDVITDCIVRGIKNRNLVVVKKLTEGAQSNAEDRLKRVCGSRRDSRSERFKRKLILQVYGVTI